MNKMIPVRAFFSVFLFYLGWLLIAWAMVALMGSVGGLVTAAFYIVTVCKGLTPYEKLAG